MWGGGEVRAMKVAAQRRLDQQEADSARPRFRHARYSARFQVRERTFIGGLLVCPGQGKSNVRNVRRHRRTDTTETKTETTTYAKRAKCRSDLFDANADHGLGNVRQAPILQATRLVRGWASTVGANREALSALGSRS